VIELAATLFVLIIVSVVISGFVIPFLPDPRPKKRPALTAPVRQPTNEQGVVALIVVGLIVFVLVLSFIGAAARPAVSVPAWPVSQLETLH
jgi:hypothetical protein